MSSLRMKKLKKLVLIVVIMALIFSLGPVFLEAWSCEDAFFQCWLENMWLPDYAIVYCGTGYAFCKKYIK
ncbi:MAG: hypothetical protein ACE5GI_02285 [Candidatus Aminicenantales bacterium]